MASRGVQMPSTGERKALSSVQVRDNYHRRLDRHIKDAVDAYRSIVESCSIKDTVGVVRGDFESQVDTSNLCKAAEGILQLISELKVASIVQEVTDTRQESHELRGVYDTEVKATERSIANLSETILPVLENLETHYYQSCTKWSKPSSLSLSNNQKTAGLTNAEAPNNANNSMTDV